jgi:hypothetical protein
VPVGRRTGPTETLPDGTAGGIGRVAQHQKEIGEKSVKNRQKVTIARIFPSRHQPAASCIPG